MHNHLKDIMQDRNFFINQIRNIFKQEPKKQVLNIIIEAKGKYLH